MNTMTSKYSEIILLALLALEIIDLCFPYLLSTGFVNLILLIGIIALVLCRLQSLDETVKQKHWR